MHSAERSVWDIWFELKRCDPPEWMEVEVRDLGGGETVEVFRHPGPERHDEKEARINYQTGCRDLARDCVEAEAGRLWATMREDAEARSLRRVLLMPEACGTSTGVSFERGADGSWSSLALGEVATR
jgi:hypothetical protein